MKPGAVAAVRVSRLGSAWPDRSALPGWVHCTPPLRASPIATSSRVKLPPRPDIRRFSSGPVTASTKPIPRSRGSSVPNLGSPSACPISLTCLTVEPARRTRQIHTSPICRAQPLERPSDRDYGYHADPYDGDDWDNHGAGFPPLRPGDIVKEDSKSAVRRYQHMVPPEIPGSSSNGQLREYEPSEDDFLQAAAAAAGVAEANDEVEDWTETDTASLPIAPELEEWVDPAAPIKRKRRVKRVAVQDRPPLLPGETLKEGEERHDVRKRALSQTPHASGSSWFPMEQRVRRERAEVKELDAGDRYFEEVKRYTEKFISLLQAEHKEVQRLHAERQLMWDSDKLKKEGWMIEDLGASLYPVKNRDGYIYTFAKTGKDAAGEKGNLAFHKFQPGTITEICRTHPQRDYVDKDGVTQQVAAQNDTVDSETGVTAPQALAMTDDKLLGSVYSVTKKFIRVSFDVPIREIDRGHWRLDVGCNDIALDRQLEAMRRLHADPTAIQRSDAVLASAPNQHSGVVPGRPDEDEAFNTSSPWQRQTVLYGTDLRDKLLRAFQVDLDPQDQSTPGPSLEQPFSAPSQPVPVIAAPHHLRPEDIDATPVPAPHPVAEPASVLCRKEALASWTRRYRADNGQPVERLPGDPEVNLNPSQMRAIALMLSERLSLVQGPPGTGKTRVIIETIKLLKQHWKLPHPILVTAHTNAAVDNLLSGLRGAGLKAARMGKEEVVRPDCREWTIERLMEGHPQYKALDQLMKDREEVERELSSAPPGQRTALYDRKSEIGRNKRAAKKSIEREVLLDSDVICATCLSAVSWTLEGIDFPIVFLDEASMATEPLSLVPLMKGSSHVAIIGDHKQLPPVIISETAQEGGLGTSMFERLIHEHHIPSIMLDTQYRMHPQIAAFPNRAFYGSALANGTVDADGNARPGLEPPRTAFLVDNEHSVRQNVTFVHHDSFEDPSSKSIRNEGEAGRVCDVVADLLYQNPDLKGSDIGIITPYIAQIRQLQEYLLADVERAEAFRNLLGDDRMTELEHIEIKTVDGFEGREKAVIIFSTVRNNHAGYIGFLADWRRLNVGLTRAKRALVIVGSANHLARAKVGSKARANLPSGGAKVWREFISWLQAEGLILRENGS